MDAFWLVLIFLFILIVGMYVSNKLFSGGSEFSGGDENDFEISDGGDHGGEHGDSDVEQ